MLAAVPTLTSAIWTVCACAAPTPAELKPTAIKPSAIHAGSRTIFIASSPRSCFSTGSVRRRLPQPLVDALHPWVIGQRALLVHHEVIVALELHGANRTGFAAEGCDKIARLSGKAGEVVRTDRDEKRRAVAFDLRDWAGTHRVVGLAQKRLDKSLAVAGRRGAQALRAGLAEIVA